jgi:hypothetical protein
MKIKKICESCSATFVVVHELDEDDYIEQYCPFCGEEHEQVEQVALVLGTTCSSSKVLIAFGLF